MKIFIYLILFISFEAISEEGHDHHDHKQQQKTLKAHEHGVSVLNIVQTSNTISFEFEMPGFDIVGFEYKAKVKEDIKKVKNALNILSNFENMVVLPQLGGCKEEKNNASVINEGTHSEFLSEYIFKCKNLSKINQIEIKFLKSFKYSKKLNINLISDNNKSSQTIDKSNATINVEGYF